MFATTHRKPLHKKGSRQRFCGPAALSALTGYTAEAVAAWINEKRSKAVWQMVKGCYNREMTHAAEGLGFEMSYVSGFDGMPLKKALRHPSFLKQYWGKRCLWVSGNHYTATFQGKIVDSGAWVGNGGAGILKMKKGARTIVKQMFVLEWKGGKRLKREPLPA